MELGDAENQAGCDEDSCRESFTWTIENEQVAGEIHDEAEDRVYAEYIEADADAHGCRKYLACKWISYLFEYYAANERKY